MPTFKQVNHGVVAKYTEVELRQAQYVILDAKGEYVDGWQLAGEYPVECSACQGRAIAFAVW